MEGQNVIEKDEMWLILKINTGDVTSKWWHLTWEMYLCLSQPVLWLQKKNCDTDEKFITPLKCTAMLSLQKWHDKHKCFQISFYNYTPFDLFLFPFIGRVDVTMFVQLYSYIQPSSINIKIFWHELYVIMKNVLSIFDNEYIVVMAGKIY